MASKQMLHFFARSYDKKKGVNGGSFVSKGRFSWISPDEKIRNQHLTIQKWKAGIQRLPEKVRRENCVQMACTNDRVSKY
jgi:hypothetical protein